MISKKLLRYAFLSVAVATATSDLQFIISCGNNQQPQPEPKELAVSLKVYGNIGGELERTSISIEAGKKWSEIKTNCDALAHPWDGYLLDKWVVFKDSKYVDIDEDYIFDQNCSIEAVFNWRPIEGHARITVDCNEYGELIFGGSFFDVVAGIKWSKVRSSASKRVKSKDDTQYILLKWTYENGDTVQDDDTFNEDTKVIAIFGEKTGPESWTINLFAQANGGSLIYDTCHIRLDAKWSNVKEYINCFVRTNPGYYVQKWVEILGGGEIDITDDTEMYDGMSIKVYFEHGITEIAKITVYESHSIVIKEPGFVLVPAGVLKWSDARIQEKVMDLLIIDEGYQLDKWVKILDSQEEEEEITQDFEINDSVIVKPKAKIKQIQILVSVGEGGKIRSGSSSTLLVDYGKKWAEVKSQFDELVEPKQGWTFTKWVFFDSQELIPDDFIIYTFVQVMAIFEIQRFTITLSSSEHGSLSRTVIENVKYGTKWKDAIYSIGVQPEAGYELKRWVEITDSGERTIDDEERIESSLNVKAIFDKKVVNIQLSTNGHGKVDKTSIKSKTATSWNVICERIHCFPDYGYRLTHWIDADTKEVISPEKLIKDSFNAQAVFEEGQYFISISTNGHGQVSTGMVFAYYGEKWGFVKQQITCTPDTTYYFNEWIDPVTRTAIHDDDIITPEFIGAQAVFAPYIEFSYDYNDDNMTATITGCTDLSYDGEVVFPTIVKHANKTYTITSIGEEAFFGSSFKKIYISGSIKLIEYGAFASCENLESVVCTGRSLAISSNAFARCINLKTIDIPRATTKIDAWAFQHCSSLTDVSGPGETCGIHYNGSMRDWRYVDRTKNWHSDMPATYVQCLDGKISVDAQPLKPEEYIDFYFRVDGTAAVRSVNSDLAPTTFRIPEYAKYNDGSGEKEYVVDTILKSAFKNLPMIKSIAIPKTVKSIDEECIQDCENLRNIQIEFNNPWFTSYDEKGNSIDEIIDKSSKTLIMQTGKSGSIYIPNGVQKIGTDVASPFINCNTVEIVDMPDTVTYIGDNAFNSWPALRKVYLPEHIRHFGKDCFSNCPFPSDDSDENYDVGFYYDGDSEVWKSWNYCNPNERTNWHNNTRINSVMCSDGITETLEEKWTPYEFDIFQYKKYSDHEEVGIEGYSGYVPETLVLPTKAVVFSVERQIHWILKKAFVGAGMQTIVISNTIRNLQDNAFENCKQLKSVIIYPGTFKEMFNHVFLNCSSLSDNSGPAGRPGICFMGTIKQWKDIDKGSGITSGTHVTKVWCIDGICDFYA